MLNAVERIPSFTMMPLYGLNCFSMMKYETLVISKRCIAPLEEKLLGRLNSREPLQKEFRYMDLKEQILAESEHEEHPTWTPPI